MNRRPMIALVLTGGGARAAYQAGVLRAIAQLVPRNAASPFAIVCGTSAGAFNAAAIAAGADNFRRSVLLLTSVWKNFHAGQVYRADGPGIAASGARWLAALMLGGLGRHNPVSLFDNAPLAQLMESQLDLTGIAPSRRLDEIAAQHLHALPRPVRFFLCGIGAMRRSGSSLASYLLFEKAFTRALIRLGCADTMARRSEVLALLAGTGNHDREDVDAIAASSTRPQPAGP